MQKNILEWKIVNKAYLDFLRNNYSDKIPRTDYGEQHYKPFFGVLFEPKDENGDLLPFVYVTAVSSAKDYHSKHKETLAFHKIFRDESLVAVVNLKFMFPVPRSELSTLQYGDIDSVMSFENDKSRSSYIQLLKFELKAMRKMELGKKARSLYSLKYRQPDNYIAKSCLDFKHLEVGASYWIEHNAKSVEENKTEATV